MNTTDFEYVKKFIQKHTDCSGFKDNNYKAIFKTYYKEWEDKGSPFTFIIDFSLNVGIDEIQEEVEYYKYLLDVRELISIDMIEDFGTPKAYDGNSPKIYKSKEISFYIDEVIYTSSGHTIIQIISCHNEYDLSLQLRFIK